MRRFLYIIVIVPIFTLLFSFVSPEPAYADNDLELKDVWKLEIVNVNQQKLYEEVDDEGGCGVLGWIFVTNYCAVNAAISNASDTFGSVSETVQNVIPAALFAILKLNWLVYKIVAYFLIVAVAWAFNLQIVNLMFGALEETLGKLESAIWEPFMFFMWAVALAWMVYYWFSGKSTKLWSTLVSSLLIIAISGVLFTNLPSFLKSISSASACVSEIILIGVSSDTAAKLENRIRGNSCQQAQEEEEELKNPDTKGATTDLQDILVRIFILDPWKLINFGQFEFANAEGVFGEDANWEELLYHRPDPEADGDDYPVYVGIRKELEEAEDDAEKNQILEKYGIFTLGQVIERIGYTATTIITSGFALLLFAAVALLCIIWQFIALGRAVMAAVYLLIALWPEYGAKEAALWGWSMIQALFMKVFYTIVLAVFVVLAQRLNEASDGYAHIIDVPYLGDLLSVLINWLLMVGMFIGLWLAMKELRQKLENIPLGNGMFLRGATNEAEEIGKKVGQVGVGVAAVAATVATGGAAAPALGAALGGKGGGALKAATSALANRGGGKDGDKNKKGIVGKGASLAGKGLKFSAGMLTGYTPAKWAVKSGVWAARTGWAGAKNLARPALKKGLTHTGNGKIASAVKSSPLMDKVKQGADKVKQGAELGRDAAKAVPHVLGKVQTAEGQRELYKSRENWRQQWAGNMEHTHKHVVGVKNELNHIVSANHDVSGTVRISQQQAVNVMKTVQQMTNISNDDVKGRLGGVLDSVASKNPEKVLKQAQTMINEHVAQIKGENAELYNTMRKDHVDMNRRFVKILNRDRE